MQRLMKKRILSFVLALSMGLSGCSNLFESFAVKDSDAANYEEATKALNDGNFDLSLEKFALLSEGYLSNPDVKKYYAGALAGKCGMNFTEMLNSLSADISTTPIFLFLMNIFDGKAVSPAHCTAAEAQIKLIWAQRTATQGEQLFMVLLSMAKMGAYLRSKADRDGAGNLGDGSTDGSFNGCANVDDDDHLTDEEITEIVTGFSLMLLNITAFSASLSGSVDGAVTAINAICSAPGVDATTCSTTEAANVTASQILTMRDILDTSTTFLLAPFGIGTCSTPTNLEDCCPP